MITNPCKSKVYSQEAIERLASWRHLYQTDAAVTIKVVSEKCDVSVNWLKSYMRRRGWSKTPAVAARAKSLNGTVTCSQRWGRQMPSAPAAPTQQSDAAWPSVFHFHQQGLVLSSGGRINGTYSGAAA